MHSRYSQVAQKTVVRTALPIVLQAVQLLVQVLQNQADVLVAQVLVVAQAQVQDVHHVVLDAHQDVHHLVEATALVNAQADALRNVEIDV